MYNKYLHNVQPLAIDHFFLQVFVKHPLHFGSKTVLNKSRREFNRSFLFPLFHIKKDCRNRRSSDSSLKCRYRNQWMKTMSTIPKIQFSKNTSYRNGNLSNPSLTTSFPIKKSPISPPSTRSAPLYYSPLPLQLL